MALEFYITSLYPKLLANLEASEKVLPPYVSAFVVENEWLIQCNLFVFFHLN